MRSAWTRKGLYPAKSFPLVLGMEASGTIAALPTDEKVLNDEEFKKRGFKVGSKVAVVSLSLSLKSIVRI